MKTKTTTKYLKSLWGNDAIKAGYCNIQYLLDFESADFYTCGIYGWNYDAYIIHSEKYGSVLITTGYRGMFGTSADLDTMRAYEKRAEKIRLDWSKDYETQKAEISKLLIEFVNLTLDAEREERKAG